MIAQKDSTLHFFKDIASLSVEWSQYCAEHPCMRLYIVDPGLDPAFYRKFIPQDGLIYIPNAKGEALKTIQQGRLLVEYLEEIQMPQSGQIVSIGGGAISDMAGFIASVWMRGIDHVIIPTTLLAMVDSSVGGKTALNTDSSKNIIGSFHDPCTSFICQECCKTLPKREWCSGVAEIIKIALIADPDFFQQLEASPLLHWDQPGAFDAIKRAVDLKSKIVYDGLNNARGKKVTRNQLNLGHTFGHAIESITNYQVYAHGEAVAIGMQLASLLSLKLGWIRKDLVDRIRAVIKAHGLPTQLKQALDAKAFLAAMRRDKKNVDRTALHFILIHEVGAVEEFSLATDIDFLNDLMHSFYLMA